MVSERLLDDDVRCAVPVDIQGRYCQRGFVRPKREVGISSAREMKLDGPEGALRPTPAIIHKDGAIGFVITVKVGSCERLLERRAQIRWRCEMSPRQRAFEPVLRPKERRRQSQRSGDDEFQAK